MSKRFGRNQKRKLRNQIEECQNAKAITDGLNRWLSERHHQDVEILQNVTRVLGDNHALLPPKIHVTNENSTNAPNRFTIPRFELPSFTPPGDGAIDESVIRHNVMNLLSLVKKDDKITNCTHVEFRYKDGKVGYAISESALHQMPEDILIGMISKEMAKMLVHNLKNGLSP